MPIKANTGGRVAKQVTYTEDISHNLLTYSRDDEDYMTITMADPEALPAQARSVRLSPDDWAQLIEAFEGLSWINEGL